MYENVFKVWRYMLLRPPSVTNYHTFPLERDLLYGRPRSEQDPKWFILRQAYLIDGLIWHEAACGAAKLKHYAELILFGNQILEYSANLWD